MGRREYDTWTSHWICTFLNKTSVLSPYFLAKKCQSCKIFSVLSLEEYSFVDFYSSNRFESQISNPSAFVYSLARNTKTFKVFLLNSLLPWCDDHEILLHLTTPKRETSFKTHFSRIFRFM